MLVLVDSGILLRLLEPTDPQHAAIRGAVRALRSRGESLVTAAQNAAEFWNVWTRPAAARGGFGLCAGDIPRDKVNDLGIIYSVWLDPSVTEVDAVDHKVLFEVLREATAKVIKKAMRNEPTIEWLLANQNQVRHYFHDLGFKGES
jgi:formaldehyde-activating enzyme involved in methanogenesis